MQLFTQFRKTGAKMGGGGILGGFAGVGWGGGSERKQNNFDRK
jgi:hypothetical protein